jgi:predicted transposase YbfD/YdcC
MPKKSHSESLVFHFSIIKDPRMERSKEHSLINILVIALCAMLCGAESFVDFEEFGEAKEEFLRSFLDLPHGIPSHDTFRRVFALLDPQQFADCFRRWSESLRQAIGAELVAIDGKTLRRSHDRAKGHGPIHMVSAWARENGLVLGQIKVNDKSNEITAIPELLRSLKLAGCIVTIDAMGCQTKIASEICAAKADFVLALKGNQSTLHDEVRTFIEVAREDGFPGIRHDFLETSERAHGRREIRRYYVTDEIDWLSHFDQWEKLRSVGMVESIREIRGEVTVERRFYISSLAANAQAFAHAVRGHWAIENTLHWSLDVSFNEDQCRVRTGYAAENLAILRHMSINILKGEATKKRGIKGKQKNASWDHSYLLKLLRF